MAYILWNKGEQSLVNTWLGNFSAGVNGVPSSSVYVGMGSKTGGVGSDKTIGNGTSQSTSLAEIGQSSAAGYARQAVNRNAGGAGGWPASSLSSGSHQTTAPQVTFTFTGTPNLNGATLWFVALSGTIATDDCLFGADLAATRNFSNGDTERITITYRQT
jgi:hypothetical protein